MKTFQNVHNKICKGGKRYGNDKSFPLHKFLKYLLGWIKLKNSIVVDYLSIKSNIDTSSPPNGSSCQLPIVF